MFIRQILFVLLVSASKTPGLLYFIRLRYTSILSIIKIQVICQTPLPSYVSLYSLRNVKLSLYQALETHRVVRRRSFPTFLENRLTDGVEVVSLTRRQPFTPSKISGTHF
jgi:hypothetical protein